ncbi:MAG: hypothetical protein ACD_37C00137G0002 [uncultured bacterium]|nr:MAG: hypothetical protein ACD_37C00137G0002 [uncultured bacterium]
MNPFSNTDVEGYAGVITKDIPESVNSKVSIIGGVDEIDSLKDGYILTIEPNGFISIIYRPESRNNVIFATAKCNNTCLMCSQPPVNYQDENIITNHLRFIDLISDNPETLCITGGEPTLLGDGLISILRRGCTQLPNTCFYVLTNGRRFSDESYVKKIAGIPDLKLLCAIPVYADVAPFHDFIVQAKGAFNETICGLYNLARYKLPIEIRVVLHKQTIPRLLPLMEFIYRNLPFVSRVALMGLENMGYARNNHEILWIDPVDYAAELESAVRFLHYRRMSVSIFNLQLCTLNQFLRPFARQSISDFKNIFLEECQVCSLKNSCAGFFNSSQTLHSRSIKAIN